VVNNIMSTLCPMDLACGAWLGSASTVRWDEPAYAVEPDVPSLHLWGSLSLSLFGRLLLSDC